MRKNLLFKSVICTILVFFVLTNFSPISAQEKILVGCFDYKGFIDRETDGSYTGYGVAYLEEIAKYTDWEYEYVYATWSECLELLKAGKIDLLTTAQYSEERSLYYDYSIFEAGVEYATLYVANDNDTIYYEDYEAFDGMHVGMMTACYQNELFFEYEAENNFKTNVTYYPSSIDLLTALHEGEVDAIVIGSLNVSTDERLVAKFGVMPFYFISSKNNRRIMDPLNSAIEKISKENPYFNSDLYREYYSTSYENLVGLTRKEANYIKEMGTLKVAYWKDYYPICYMDNNSAEYKGIYGELWKKIEQFTGISAEFIEVSSYEEAIQWLEHGQIDIISSNYYPSRGKAVDNVNYTNGILSANYIFVAKNETENWKEKAAIVALPRSGIGIANYITEFFPNWKILYGNNAEECLRAVSNGKADVTLLDSIFLQTVININDYKDLTILTSMDATIQVCIALSSKYGKVLVDILNKAIGQISKDEINKLMANNIINAFHMNTSRSWLVEYKWIFVSIGIVLLVILSIIVFWIIKKIMQEHGKGIRKDPLTKLWNYDSFIEMTQHKIEQDKEETYYIVTADVDKFKYINDQYGYEYGNLVLKKIASVFMNHLNNYGYLGKGTADCFYILIEKSKRNQAFLDTLDCNNEEFFINNAGKTLRIPIKFGVYEITKEYQNRSIYECIDKANIAKSMIKGNHNKCIAFYNKNLEQQILNENEIEGIMEEALDNHEFLVYYQPKFDLLTNELIGAEALVRWLHPQKGMITPDQFIPLFEKNGFIISLDFYVYEDVMKTMQAWKQQGRNLIPIAINMSRCHISSHNFVERLLRLVHIYDIPTEYIEIELTESILGEATENIFELLTKLKELGFKISIDDFGTGFSSLTLLKEMPVDILKIDKGFLQETQNSHRSRIIIEQVVEMARKINIKTICEGVETEKQAEFLKNIGCNMVQGYLYSKPVSLGEFEKMF